MRATQRASYYSGERMASLRLKRKRQQPSDHGAAMGSVSGSNDHPPEPLSRNRRKRRKDKVSWIEYTLTPYLDGRSWRKYGEKSIKDSLFHRLYFRCSYHEGRKCKALKQVQQETFDDPPLFSVTYKHDHTCDVAPVPAPDVGAIAAELGPPAASHGGLVLRFSSSSDDSCHRDAPMQQEWEQYHHQPVPLSSSFLMTSSCSWNAQWQDHQPAFPSDDGMPAFTASWSSSSFPITESLPMIIPPWTDDEGGMMSMLERDSFDYYLGDHHLHRNNNHVEFQGESSGSSALRETGNCAIAHILPGIEAEEVFF
ncbi:hypothetical protein ACP4OV_011017 [Aristida adscensionis]